MLRHVPHWLGRNDAAAASFEPSEELRAALGRSTAGEVSPLTWRLGSSRTPYETLLPIVVAQRVTGKEAGQAYRRLVRRYGTPGPGPAPTWIAPDPNTLRHIDLDKLTAMGIDAQRGRTLHAVARAHRHLEALPDLPRDQAYQRLLRISGVGPWSAAKLMLCACGDADAVWIGDAHLPDLVAWNLRAEARADDERLLNILEPYRGHRARVARLLELRGHSKPRFGARHSVQRYR
jgi:3-methyladenine DNA glycosylase/8-oxoguanine DNA glycosylase